jgi:hypothetical protein
VQDHGVETASQLLADMRRRKDLDSPDDTGEPVIDDTNVSVRVKPESVESFEASKRMDFFACLLTKDDNDILNEWIAYHYALLLLLLGGPKIPKIKGSNSKGSNSKGSNSKGSNSKRSN